MISRFYSDGQLDNEFGSSGTILTTVGVNWSECQAATLQPDGKIVCAGDIFNGASYDFALTRHIQDVVSGLDDLEHNPINTLTVSPNPADQEVYFQYSLSQKSYVSAEIRDAMGRLKKSLLFQDERIPGNYTEVFNAVDLLSGVYFLKLSTSDDKSRICRFVKK